MNDLSSQLSPLDLYPSLKMSRQLDDLNMRWKLLQVFFWMCPVGVWGGIFLTLLCFLKRCTVTICSLLLSLKCYSVGTNATKGAVFPSVASPNTFTFNLFQQFIQTGNCIKVWGVVGAIAAWVFCMSYSSKFCCINVSPKTCVKISVVFPACVKAVLFCLWMFRFCRKFCLEWFMY